MARAGAAALCLVLIACVEFGACTRCYVCISTMDPSCGDPFTSSKNLKDCTKIEEISEFNNINVRNLDSELVNYVNNSPRYCHKIVTQSGIVIRSCFDGNPNNINATCARLEQTVKHTPNDMSRQLKHCSVCNKDNCNGASASFASLSFALGAAMLAYFSCRQ